jgi:hypothetical protein
MSIALAAELLEQLAARLAEQLERFREPIVAAAAARASRQCKPRHPATVARAGVPRR